MSGSHQRRVIARLAICLALAPAAPVVMAATAGAATTARAFHVTRITDNGTKNARHWVGHVHDALVITFTECTDCGYQWRVISKAKPALVKTTGKATPAPSEVNGHPVVGGTGTHTYTFKARAVGTTVAKLGYFGPAATKPSRVVTIKITIIK